MLNNKIWHKVQLQLVKLLLRWTLRLLSDMGVGRLNHGNFTCFRKGPIQFRYDFCPLLQVEVSLSCFLGRCSLVERISVWWAYSPWWSWCRGKWLSTSSTILAPSFLWHDRWNLSWFFSFYPWLIPWGQHSGQILFFWCCCKREKVWATIDIHNIIWRKPAL